MVTLLPFLSLPCLAVLMRNVKLELDSPVCKGRVWWEHVDDFLDGEESMVLIERAHTSLTTSLCFTKGHSGFRAAVTAVFTGDMR